MGCPERAMISPIILERDGDWRRLGLGAILLVVVSPVAPLLWRGAATLLQAPNLGVGFEDAIVRSLLIAAWLTVVALVLGVPCGLFAALYQFPARTALLAGLALPLLLPSFLWAIGLSNLRIGLGLARESVLGGSSGSVFAFACMACPLVVFSTILSVRSLPANMLAAARLAGGEMTVLRYASRISLPGAVAGALLGAAISMTDAGPGQILGAGGTASQILISFSALYDFETAALQSMVAAALALAVATPGVWWVARHFDQAATSRDARLSAPSRHAVGSWAAMVLCLAVLLLTLVAPLTGLATSAFKHNWMDRVVAVAADTGFNSLYYAIIAAFVATTLGTSVALGVGRIKSLQTAVLGFLIAVFVLPSALFGIGAVFAGSAAPAWLDPLFRGRFVVGLVTGLRLTPLAAVLMMRALAATEPNWALAAGVHGVSLGSFVRRVLAPYHASSAMVAAGLVGLLALADVTTVMLLQPPGESSYAASLFTVMANAPESLVANLCLFYVAVAGATSLLVTTWLARPTRTDREQWRGEGKGR
jgi:ABC-type Fe3+ transport system permease subunit